MQFNILSKIEGFQKLLTLIYSSPALRADPAVLASNTLVSLACGRLPFRRLRDAITDQREDDIGLLQAKSCRHTSYWRRRGLMIDIVILNQVESGYDEGLQVKIYRTVSRNGNNEQINKRQGYLFCARIR
jgi:hypothetical protein